MQRFMICILAAPLIFSQLCFGNQKFEKAADKAKELLWKEMSDVHLQRLDVRFLLLRTNILLKLNRVMLRKFRAKGATDALTKNRMKRYIKWEQDFESKKVLEKYATFLSDVEEISSKLDDDGKNKPKTAIRKMISQKNRLIAELVPLKSQLNTLLQALIGTSKDVITTRFPPGLKKSIRESLQEELRSSGVIPGAEVRAQLCSMKDATRKLVRCGANKPKTSEEPEGSTSESSSNDSQERAQ